MMNDQARGPDERTDGALVHRYLLEQQARTRPNSPFLSCPEEGVRWTWQEARAVADESTAALAALGVVRGDVVAFLHPNGSSYLRYLLGALTLGAVVAPLNEAYRGSMLAHAVRLAGPRLVVTCSTHLPRLHELDGPTHTLVTDGDPVAGDRPAPEPAPIHYWDPYAVVFTSGTTGPSKGVLSPYGQIHAVLKDNFLRWVDAGDVVLLDAPIFHISGLLMLYTSLATGARLVVYPKFSASQFLRRVRQEGVTVATVPAQDMVFAQLPQDGDGSTPLRLVLVGRHSDLWSERFGVERTLSFYNMSEISSPLQVTGRPRNPRSVGMPRPGVEVRVVDDNDLEVAPGRVGQLIVRTDRPWEMNLGYVANPAATAEAWRNGWFHTGDAFRRDEATGEFLFVDRQKDCVRRRGENISSYEVEAEIRRHPGIDDCAVVAAPGDVPGDEEVRAFVVCCAPAQTGPDALWTFLEEHLPLFMIPRFIDFVEELPMTESGKVKKAELRARPPGGDSHDRLSPRRQ